MSEVIVKKVANAKKVTAWSYSRLSAYEQCPLKFKLTTLDGLKEPTSLAMERGKDIHKEGELYLGDISLPIPPSYKLLAVEMAALRALKVQSELEVTFTKDWQPTGWFDTDAWCRIKIDALAIDEGVVKIIDFKTGKNRGGYEDQLELYVLASLLMYPEHPTVTAELWFLDSGEIIGTSHKTYNQKAIDKLKKKWTDRVQPLFLDDMWAPRANQYCRFCQFRKEEGGQCQY